MKRKVTAAITSLALLFGGTAAVMADDAAVSSPGGAAVSDIAAGVQLSNEEITATVKSKIDIPEELTEFTINYSTNSDGRTVYRLSWSSEQEPGSISVTADAQGHILSFNRYVPHSEYSDAMVSDDRSSVLSAVESKVKTMLPECFTETDTYKLDSSTFSMNGSGSASYIRYKDGIQVWSNNIYVSFSCLDGEYIITNAGSSHDYEARFGENTDGENISERYRELAAGKLEYNLIYDYDDKDGVTHTPVLRYVIQNAPFMDPVTGEEIIEDKTDLYATNSSSGGGDGSNPESAADSGLRVELTPEELAEISAVNSLKTADDVAAELTAIPELAISGDMKVQSTNIYKTDDKYYMYLLFSNEQDGEGREDYAYCGVTVNAQNGKLIDFYSNKNYFAWDSSENKMTDEELAEVSGEDFLKKYADGFENYAVSEKSGYTDDTATVQEFYNKIINGIPYTGSSAQITYNADTGEVYSMSISEITPDAEFPDPADAVSEETAFDTLTSTYPVTPVFVKSDGVYKKAYVLAEKNGYVDAIENKVVNSWDNTPITETDGVYSYDDISGHWAEDIINRFAQFGIGFDGGSFKPDEYITAGDLIRLTEAVVQNETGSVVPLLTSLGLDEDAEDYDENALVTRETAVTAIVKYMGYGTIADLENIFITGFNDEAQISPECLGSCAIAKGMGIVNGSNGNFNPKQNVTRAEVISMLYNYKMFNN